MTSRRPSATLARRGVLLSGPALLLAGCGLLPSGGGSDAAPDADDTDGDGGSRPADGADGDGTTDQDAADPATSATLDITVLEVTDEVVAGGMMQRLETSETLVHPFARATVTATALLDSLTAEQYTALTGEEAPPPDGADPVGEDSAASTLLPGELKKFLLASWESTDSEWAPPPSLGLTTLQIAHGGNDEIRLDSVEEGDAERSGIVLAVVDASPDPAAVTLRAEIEGGVQEISLVDGSIVATAAPGLYTRELEAEVSDAEVFEADVLDGFADDTQHVRGTVGSAFLTPFIWSSSLTWGGNLGWAAEDEIYVVVELDWEKNYSANVTELGEIVLVLPDGTELSPAQDEKYIYEHHRDNIATFTMPVHTESATVRITPRFERAVGSDDDQTYDPITATLTFR